MADDLYSVDGLPKFDLPAYIEYLKSPQWYKDDFDTESAYQSYWCGKIKDWRDQSEAAFKWEKEVWQTCFDALDMNIKKGAVSSQAFERNIAGSKIPFMANEMHVEVAALYSSDYIPTLVPLSEQVGPLVGLGNQYLRLELNLNDFAAEKFELGRDGYVTNMWILKVYVVDADGPFGQDKKIVIERIDPRNCFFDEKAQCLEWPYMDFFIVEQDLDIGVVRDMFKEKANLIDKHLATTTDEPKKRYNTSQLITMPGQRPYGVSSPERLRVKLKECWLHDERLKFVAEDTFDSEGNPTAKVDEDGYVIGNWEKAYPYGRCFYTADDKVILRDMPNPYWHKELPYVFCQQAPASKTIGVGKGASVLLLDRKLNDLESRSHAFLQASIERPVIMDQGAMPSTSSYWMPNQNSRNVVFKVQGKDILGHMPPVELPQSEALVIARYQGYMQATTGQSAIARGQVAEGAQLSAEAVQGMQGNANSVLSMQSVYISRAMKELGNKLFWVIRETYPEDKMQVQITGPDGQPKTVDWNDPSSTNDYFVDIDLAANQPGGRQAQMNQALSLYREGIVNRDYVLKTLQIPGWEQLAQQIRQEELDKIKTQAEGREIGLHINKLMKPDSATTPGPSAHLGSVR